MAARGHGLFSLYIYIDNFRNLLVRNHLTDINITWQKCSYSDPLSWFFKMSWYVKTWPPEGGLIFSLYLYRKLKKKTLLVRNLRTDFNITTQNYSFGNPLPRSFNDHDSSKNMAFSGQGLFFLYIFIENFENLPVRNHRTDFNIT